MPLFRHILSATFPFCPISMPFYLGLMESSKRDEANNASLPRGQTDQAKLWTHRQADMPKEGNFNQKVSKLRQGYDTEFLTHFKFLN